MKLYKFNIILCSLLVLVLMGLNLFLPDTATISSAENRKLEEKPELTWGSFLSGHYFESYDSYFADHFVFREPFVDLSKHLKNYTGLKGNTVGEIVVSKGENTYDGIDAVNVEFEDEDPTTVLFLEDRALTLYTFDAVKAERYVDAFNTLAARMPQNVRMTSMLVPDQIQFMDDPRLKDLADSQADTMTYLKGRLNPRIALVDLMPTFEAQKDAYLFFRTDHHWTALGAYYAYSTFMESQGETPIPLDDYTATNVEGYLGTRVPLNDGLKAHPDTLTYYKYKGYDDFKFSIFKEGVYKETALINTWYLKGESKYAVFMGSDHPLAKIETSNPNGKTLLVIKDSYANAFVPFLAPHYSTVYVIDPRYATLDIYDFIQENAIEDVLFLNSIHATNRNRYARFIKQLVPEEVSRETD